MTAFSWRSRWPTTGLARPNMTDPMKRAKACTSCWLSSMTSRFAGDVLELACGTGQWTPRLAARARSVTAVDAAAEVLALAHARAESPKVQFLQAGLFAWQPPRRYDTVFFPFWLSHVPPMRLPAFWNTVAAALAPGGKAIFVDDGPAAAAHEEVLANQPAPAAVRRLDDGSQYRIVKVFHDAQSLTDDLTALGWSVRIRTMAGNFIGIAEPPTSPGQEATAAPA